MFIACWEAVQGTDNPLRKEIFACINCIMTGLQFVRVATRLKVTISGVRN